MDNVSSYRVTNINIHTLNKFVMPRVLYIEIDFDVITSAVWNDRVLRAVFVSTNEHDYDDFRKHFSSNITFFNEDNDSVYHTVPSVIYEACVSLCASILGVTK